MPRFLLRGLLVIVSGGLAWLLAWPFMAEHWFEDKSQDVELRRVEELPRPEWAEEEPDGDDPAPPDPGGEPGSDPDASVDPENPENLEDPEVALPTPREPGEGARIALDWDQHLPPPPLVREHVFTPIPLESAKSLFPIGDGLSTYDPHSGYRYLPGLESMRILEEHPLGRWALRTNATGHRRDADMAQEPPDLRIVVTGDSHTDGVCNNDESHAGRLEALLTRRLPGRTVEVLNAGKGGYTFYNYLGVLRRHVRWRPDVFVVTVYGGNDFMEALLLHAYFNELEAPTGSKPYWPQVKAAIALRKVAMAQALLSLKYFAHRPEEIPVAFAAAQQMLRYTRQVCKENDIRLVVAYLPPVTDVDPEFPWLALDLLTEALELGPDDLGSSDHLADLLLTWLESRGVETLDLRPAFRAAEEDLYWARDLHVNTAGHRLIASELAPLFTDR